ncbi:MAG TPA: hypothetical protein VKB67_01150 [Rhizomicrobium sp.]|nr:hypothetical protein [Rhizomicrobium sp.]
MIGAILVTPQARATPGNEAASLRAFEARLEANPSATRVLQTWCDAHAPKGTRIAARQIQTAPAPLPREARDALQLRPEDVVHYRRVQLMCGARVLSNAENWYLPGKLTEAMNETLDHTEMPFGAVAAPLHFSRHNLETRYLSPAARDRGVLRHTAMLLTGKGEPFSFVVETYTREILAPESHGASDPGGIGR